METITGRTERDHLASLLDELPQRPGSHSRNVRVDAALLELAAAMLQQLSAAFPDERIGRAAGSVADRIRLNVPLTAILALKSTLEAGNLNIR
ncbi:hypothetical protein AB0D08_34065 [Kitasatospora sp. NPDC048540]|uniref:hypothetical protein n=1 Tax=unclassified Kitasatospora TaxID=2633591 RepID=UPI00053A7D3A|nr:hypothetical protein [Kitasatospora sp. MBT63]